MEENKFQFTLSRYSAESLFSHATFKDGYVCVSEEFTTIAELSKERKRDCHVFSQTLKEFSYLGPKELELMYILIDFSTFKDFDLLADNPNGIKLIIDGREITYVMFLKSSSMSKKCNMLFINNEYYDAINERVNFHYDEVDNLLLAKWYAYSGLALTDAIIIENLKFNFDEVCVVPDLNVTTIAKKVVTGVSVPLILDKLTQFRQSKDTKERSRIKQEFECYLRSPDYPTLGIKNLIDDGYKFILNPKDNQLFYNIIETYGAITEFLSTIDWEKISLDNYPMDINMFDGEGLIDVDSANKINEELVGDYEVEYIDEDDDQEFEEANISHSFQIRLPFVKGVVHECNFKEFFKKHHITHIKGLTFSNGEPLHDYDVNKLKLILTESQFKASAIFKQLLKSYPEKECLKEYFDNLHKYDYSLAVSGLEPKMGEDVKLCYQFLSTMPLEEEALSNLLAYNTDYLDEKTDLDNMLEEMATSKDIKDIHFLDCYKNNRDLALTTTYLTKRRAELFKTLKDHMKVGQLYTPGCRKILCSDLLALLYHAAGLKMNKEDELGKDSFTCPSEGLLDYKDYVLLRNPHYSRNEIVMLNHDDTNFERGLYFKQLTGVCMVNPLSFASERLGGADYDGDTIIVIEDDDIIKSCMNNLIERGNYIYPVVKIPSLKVKRMNFKTNSYKQKVTCLRDTFNSRTGLISNIAYSKADKIYNGHFPISASDSIAFFTILGGLEIDSAKSGKKPNLEAQKEEYKEPLFIMLKDHVLAKRNIKERKMSFKTAEKNYIDYSNKTNANDTIFLTYEKFKELKVAPIEFSKINLRQTEDLPYEKIKDIIVTHETLMYLNAGLDRVSKINRGNSKEIKHYITNQIYEILDKNGYALDYVLKFIAKFDSFKPYETFAKYCDDNCYHFFTNTEDKLRYLDELQFKLTSFDKSIITNFNNGGYKLLYLLLYYHKLPIACYDINLDLIVSKEDPFTHVRKEIKSKLTKDQMNELKMELFNSLANISNEISFHEKASELKAKYEKELKLDKSKYSIEDVNSVIEVSKTPLLYSTYYDLFAKHIKEGK